MNAPEKATEIKAAITMVFAFLTALWGWIGWAIILWVLLIMMDYVTGSMAARRERNWSSENAREGLWHTAGEIFAVLVAALCDIALSVIANNAGFDLPFEIGPLLTPVVLVWYILTEAGSILENCGRLGAPLPKWFKQYVEKCKDTIDTKRENEGDKAAAEAGPASVPEIEAEIVGKHEAGNIPARKPEDAFLFEPSPEDVQNPDTKSPDQTLSEIIADLKDM